MKVHYLKTLASSQAQEDTLANLIANAAPLPAHVKNKDTLIKWRENPHTTHVFFSPYEGLTPKLRVSQKGGANQAWVVHGFVADFDQKIKGVQEMNDAIALNQKPDFPVSYASRTYSGGAHLVWEFEKPINVVNTKMLDGFIKTFVSQAGVKKILGGFDEASLKPSLYYTLYDQWQSYGQVVSENLLQNILFNVGKSTKPYESEGPSLPWDLIESEITTKFPGRWKGKFEEGARGIRFWDPSATHPNGAMLTSTGAAYFTDGGGFVPWGSVELFGPSVVRKFQANTIGQAIKDIYYDGKTFYRYVNDRWLQDNTTTIQLALAVEGMLSRSKPKTKDFTEVDEALHHICLNNRVDGSMPFCYCKDRIIRRNDGTFINTSNVKCHDMVTDPVTWGQGFPFIAAWLDRFFYNVQQKRIWLAWLHHFYKNAYDGKPLPGQSMFIVGEAEVGKTLMNHRLLGWMMGGQTDISGYITGDDNFNENLFKFGLATVDDQLAASDHKSHLRFSALVKKLTANRSLTMRAMYKGAVDIEWCGRVSITMNSDPESMRMLPDLDINNKDKLIILRTAPKSTITFPVDVEDIIKAELPYFCRYIYDFGIPPECRGSNRYQVVAFIDPVLQEEAEFSSYGYAIIEMVREWRESYFTSHPDETEWFGGVTKLIPELSAEFGGTPQCMAGITPGTLSKQLMKEIPKQSGGWISRVIRNGARGFLITQPDDDEDLDPLDPNL